MGLIELLVIVALVMMILTVVQRGDDKPAPKTWTLTVTTWDDDSTKRTRTFSGITMEQAQWVAAQYGVSPDEVMRATRRALGVPDTTGMTDAEVRERYSLKSAVRDHLRDRDADRQAVADLVRDVEGGDDESK